MQPRYLLLCLLLLGASLSRAQVKITDTIFYNGGWQISEQETAKYYRAGILAALDSFWYYTGKVKDHTIDGKLLMEGNYSPVGQKHGKFIFYYPEGGKRFYGDFDKDRMVGVWSWLYPNGNLHAMIYFPGDGKTFQFIKFLDQSGKQTLENGIGDFSWHTAPLYAAYAGYFVEGSVDKGKRTGTWSYSSGDGSSKVLFREKYDKEGALDKVVVTDFGKAGKRDPFPIDFIPLNLRVTESIAYDPFFAVNGDSMVTMSLASYLIDRKSTTITAKNKQFDSAFQFMIGTLYNYQHKFDYKNKEFDAKVEFRIGESKTPEEITVTGKIDSADKAYLIFLMKKFQNIDMPTVENIGYEAYHSLYLYSIDVQPYFPAEIRIPDKQLFISPLPKEKMIAILDASKKSFKKFIRRNYIRY